MGLLQSIVVQTILYGTVSYIEMTKQQVKDLEKIQKDAIYDVLGLSKFANYSAVLAEIGLLKMEESIKFFSSNGQPLPSMQQVLQAALKI